MNFKMMSSIVEAVQYGSSVADPATWKTRQVAANAIVGLLSAASIVAAQAGWLPSEVDSETLANLGEGIALVGLSVINIIGVWTTSKKVGPGKKKQLSEDIPNDDDETPWLDQ